MALVLHTFEADGDIEFPSATELISAEFEVDSSRNKPADVLWTSLLKPAPEFSAWFRFCEEDPEMDYYNPNRGHVYDDRNLSYLAISDVSDLSKLERFICDGRIDHEAIAQVYDGFFLGEKMVGHELFAQKNDAWDVESQAIYTPRKLIPKATLILDASAQGVVSQVNQLLAESS